MAQNLSEPAFRGGLLLSVRWSNEVLAATEWTDLRMWLRNSGWRLLQAVWLLEQDYSYLALLTVVPYRSPSTRTMSEPEPTAQMRKSFLRRLRQFGTERLSPETHIDAQLAFVGP